MYLGRILAVGMNSDKKPFVAYRVSSRHFPNRQAKVNGKEAAIIPRPGFETDIFKNTYIAYNCIRIVNNLVVVSNGSQTDVIADKLAMGMNIKDALAYSLLTMDYEKDDYHTPRIAAVVTSSTNEDEYEAYVGIVTDSKILVEKLDYGQAVYISVYEHQEPHTVEYDASTSEEIAQYIFDQGEFADFEHPVTSVASVYDDGWDTSAIVPDFDE
ncbi:IMP cyclohydrolase [Methanobrevibacter sp. 87.7]|uniref:IMP cyclohydrolase n=1 Tax=Methanobrevibacter sp. 87.7 TaxID=387957 RepID=UPI000B5017A5|nr:IMP cyclohydrolase [Methanobrevibacter sp. 87.7]OWT32887.1 IMP cyclohydrolase [Methanobrevibacter sp. 87.7]